MEGPFIDNLVIFHLCKLRCRAFYSFEGKTLPFK
jgi:hypothetical protein